ncbi:MAG: 2-hydroxychromene-2-carboxylate isomerase [Rubrivivax sp.]|nr:2-hydroxychromene-2-carboxylate isomerase [Rubrivivax sp.]
MKPIVFHFDPISPFAWLAFERLPQELAGLSHAVEYRPVLLGALLKQHAHKGPAEIEPKRQWTFRHVQWLAQHHGIPLQTPAQHPFNPLALLRLAVACGPNRRVVEALFRHVWCGGGADANEPERLAALREALAPARDPDGEDVKAELRAHTEAAIAAGVFGVPSFELEGRVFWGLDALPMLREALQGSAWFAGPAWDEAAQPRPGLRR